MEGPRLDGIVKIKAQAWYHMGAIITLGYTTRYVEKPPSPIPIKTDILKLNNSSNNHNSHKNATTTTNIL